MNNDEFRAWSRRAADWGADYRDTLRKRPVRPALSPGAIFRSIEASPPEAAESMDRIFADFEQKIVPGMTHWQHPRFFAYFPANAAPVSVVAEYLVSAMAAQCMLWQTSPAATASIGVPSSSSLGTCGAGEGGERHARRPELRLGDLEIP